MNGVDYVTNHGRGDDGTISDIPWASVFDPVVNVRALGEIQARGFRAATDLVDRFIRQAPQSAGGSADPSTTEATPADATERPAPNAEQVLGAWQRLVGQAVQSLGERGKADHGAAFDFVGETATGNVHLESAGSGTVAGEVWLHNGGLVDLGKIRLRCSDLLAHDGAVISSEAVRFDPDPVDMPARSSRGVTVEVDVDDGVRPGSYRGTLLADGFPDVWLPIALRISPTVE